MYSCWVIYNGSLTSDKFKDQAVLLKKLLNVRVYKQS